MGRKKANDQPKSNSFTEINKLIAKFLEDVARDFSEYSDEIHSTEPITYRFNLEINPSIRQSVEQRQEPRDHLVDTIDRANDVTIIVEMPGVGDKDVRVVASASEIIVEDKSMRGPSRRIRLPSTVDPGSGSARLRNGILEIVFNKAGYSNKSAVFGVMG